MIYVLITNDNRHHLVTAFEDDTDSSCKPDFVNYENKVYEIIEMKA